MKYTAILGIKIKSEVQVSTVPCNSIYEAEKIVSQFKAIDKNYKISYLILIDRESGRINQSNFYPDKDICAHTA
jgi:hypothetical protein